MSKQHEDESQEVWNERHERVNREYRGQPRDFGGMRAIACNLKSRAGVAASSAADASHHGDEKGRSRARREYDQAERERREKLDALRFA